MSSVLIRRGLPQPERLATLNDIAITQHSTNLTVSVLNPVQFSTT